MCGCRSGGNRNMVVNNNRSVATNNNRSRSKDMQNMEILEQISKGEDFVNVIYNGPKHPHYMPTLADYVRKLYGITNYGYGKQGAILRVHNYDVMKAETNAAKSGAKPLYERIELPKEEEKPEPEEIEEVIIEESELTEIEIVEEIVNEEVSLEEEITIEEEVVIEEEKPKKARKKKSE